MFSYVGGEYHKFTGAAVTAPPFTMAGFCIRNDSTGEEAIVSVSRDNTNNHTYELFSNGNDQVALRTQSGGTTINAATSATFNTGQIFHAVGVLAGAADFRVYLDGGNKVTSGATAAIPTGLAVTNVGATKAGGDSLNGHAGESAIWNVALDDAEIAALAKGFSPLLIRPGSLVFYNPGIREAKDIIGGRTLTTTGTPTVSAHPGIIQPSAQIIQFPPIAVGVAGNPWNYYAQQ